MRGANQRVIALVEEILTKDELYVLILFHPDTLRQLAEGTVKVGIGKLSLYLSQITVFKCFLEHGDGVQ